MKKASNTRFKHFKETVSSFAGKKKVLNFSSMEISFKGKIILMSTGSKNGKKETCSLELEAPNLQKKTAKTQKKER